ncbi:IclR family transcriptional regulator C-terminal domain-containing protein [Streptomyces sp. NL15-2K]|uniref:IclR family transcriptional regulator domain-containing protein n=1 Tax=Streptomyces sp. NL15-2K TaxID=376149 RepID=UPI000F571547|nr:MULTISPECIES: IclR family transcriptional regulator C-terminal domain-containing protein [Actinomycetes]WKX09948.1 IclR family transcriptional regulator C-terminal domain-containing protein [Kutzneria buriramensis]GCB48503.1 iclR family transcriptional regulator [Streptomyces sp. NL15-2K]
MPAETTLDAPEPADSPAVPAEAVTPLIRGVTVLRRLTEAGGTLSASGLERATGLARSTVDRIASTLARMEYVRLDGRDVVLAPRLMELGNAYLAALRLPALLDARADALADELDESVSLAVGDRDGIRFIHQATRRRAMSLSFRIGDLLPAERTAPGPLFATEWTQEDWRAWRARRAADPEDRGFPAVPPREHTEKDEEFGQRAARAREDGWALDDQLIEPGLVAVSVPVRDPRSGRIACVASVVSHTSRHTAADLRDTLLPRLRGAVTDMERELREAPEAEAEAGAAPSGLAAWTGASKQELGREFIESLARGLTVLTAFGEGRAELTLTEVAKATGLARATARRALLTYEHLGLVAPSSRRTFVLTPRVLSLGFPPLSRTSLPRIAGPHLADLAARVQESASLAVLTASGEEVQVTARAAARRVMSVDIRVGTRLPAAATSLGRVLLAGAGETGALEVGEVRARGADGRDSGALEARARGTDGRDTGALEARARGTDGRDTGALEEARAHGADARDSGALGEARARGYALVDEEWEEGLRSIAVPVRDRTGKVVAAANVALHAARRTAEECVLDVLPELTATAARIEADLGVAGRFTRVPLV